jgi:tRNA/tmRNA/rRNA uracil-C5-methylase (TrmA/RlmC/RlmD family)
MDRIFHIEKLVHGGYGLSRTDDGVVFVPHVLPGETVRGAVDARIGGVPLASVMEIVEPSPLRRTPACPLFGDCGGCDWLHIAYEEQIRIKLEILKECLKRIGKIKEIPEVSVISSPEFGYRIRCRFAVDRAKNAIGFFRKNTNTVVPVPHCPLLSDSLNLLLSTLSVNKDTVQALPLNVKAIAGTRQPTKIQGISLDGVASSPFIKGLTEPSTSIRTEPFVFGVRGDSFFQSNGYLLGKLGICANNWVGGKTCLDCFGGTGFFSVFCASKFTKGTLVERRETDVACAQENFRTNGVTHFSAITADVQDLLSRADVKRDGIDCCILDPPRTGLDGRIRTALATLSPGSILYVSCDPATLARDAGYLIHTGGYSLVRAALFDLYPQTHHVEAVFLFTKENGPA